MNFFSRVLEYGQMPIVSTGQRVLAYDTYNALTTNLKKNGSVLLYLNILELNDLIR